MYLAFAKPRPFLGLQRFTSSGNTLYSSVSVVLQPKPYNYSLTAKPQHRPHFIRPRFAYVKQSTSYFTRFTIAVNEARVRKK